MVKQQHKNQEEFEFEFECWYLTPLSAIFQLYHGEQVQRWRKPEDPERTTDPGQATGKLYHQEKFSGNVNGIIRNIQQIFVQNGNNLQEIMKAIKQFGKNTLKKNPDQILNI